MSELLHPGEELDDFVQASRALFRNPADCSFPLSPPANEVAREPASSGHSDITGASDLGATTLRFVFWQHIPRNQKYVIPLLEGCDIIAHESILPQVHGSRSMKNLAIAAERSTENRMSNFMSKRTGKPDRTGLLFVWDEMVRVYRKVWVAGHATDSSTEIYNHFVDQVEGTERLDVGPQEAEDYTELLDKEEKANQQFLDEVYTIGASWDDLEYSMLEWVETKAATMDYRHRLAVRQITGLVEKYPGKTIGILYGSAHHLLTRMIDLEGVAMQRFFAEQEEPFSKVSQLNDVLRDSMSAGVYGKYELNRRVLYSIAIHRGDWTNEEFEQLDDGGAALLIRLLKTIWKDRIYKDDPDAQERSDARRTLTAKVLEALRPKSSEADSEPVVDSRALG